MAGEPPGRLVVDASVAAKLYFEEAGSQEARRVLKSGSVLLAPDLLFIEMASLALKRLQRGLSTMEQAARSVLSIPKLIDHVTPMAELSERAFRLAAGHGFSAYEGAYLVLAERAEAVMITADLKFARQAADAGLSEYLMILDGL